MYEVSTQNGELINPFATPDIDSEVFDPHQILLPYQRKWIADQSRLKVAEKSRRTGITWATSLEGVLTSCASPVNGGQDTWYTIAHEDDAREFVEDAAAWAKSLGVTASSMGEEMIKDEEQDILAFRIRFASGFKLTGLSSNVRRLRGKEGLLIADEAAHNENLPELMKAARAYVMWGRGRLVLISSHNGTASYFNYVVEQIRAGQMEGTLHRITLYDAVRQGLYRRICQKNQMDWTEAGEKKWVQDLVEFYGEYADEELHCIPTGSSGRYLTRDIIEQCMHDAPVIRLKFRDDFATLPEKEKESRVRLWCQENLTSKLFARVPDWASIYFGQDFGRTSDLTVLAPLYLNEAMVRIIPFLVEMKNVPFEQQKQVMFHILDHYRDRINRHGHTAGVAGGLCDAGGNGASAAEAVSYRYGGRVRAVHLAAGAPRDPEKRVGPDGRPSPSLRYSEFLPPFRAHLEDKAVLIPKDRDILGDLEMFERRDGFPCLPKKRAKGAHGYRHGDAGIAICLAHHASLSAANPGGVVEIRRRKRMVSL